jgi:hypothetical protein
MSSGTISFADSQTLYTVTTRKRPSRDEDGDQDAGSVERQASQRGLKRTVTEDDVVPILHPSEARHFDTTELLDSPMEIAPGSPAPAKDYFQQRGPGKSIFLLCLVGQVKETITAFRCVATRRAFCSLKFRLLTQLQKFLSCGPAMALIYRTPYSHHGLHSCI